MTSPHEATRRHGTDISEAKNADFHDTAYRNGPASSADRAQANSEQDAKRGKTSNHPGGMKDPEAEGAAAIA
jgi:hypothetical protein